MSIEGQLEYGGTHTLQASMPNGILALTGEDGKYYIKANHTFQAVGSQGVNLSQIDTETLYHWTLSQAEARTQLGTLGLSGVVSSSWYFGSFGGVVAPGTPYILIPMFIENYGSPARTVNIWLRYKVDASSDVVFDGYTGGACDGTFGSVGALGYVLIGPGELSNPVYAALTAGDDLYLAMQTGTPNLFFPPGTTKCHVVKVPLTTDAYSDVSGSWDQYITELPSDTISLVTEGTARLYTNPMSLMVEPGGGGNLRAFIYLDNTQGTALGYGGAALLTSLVNPSNHTASAWSDCSAEFGIPFPDTLYDFAGNLTTNPRNDYTAPTVVSNSLHFMRPYDDQLNLALDRKFIVGGANLANITTLDPVQGAYTTVNPSGLNGQVEFIQGARIGNTFYTMGRFNTQYVFGNMGRFGGNTYVRVMG